MKPSMFVRFFILLSLISAPAFAQIENVVINEFLASNNAVNTDKDGDYSDWIELYNTGSNDVDLAGVTITDDASDPGQWTFPALTISGHGYLLIWASGKDRTTGGLHTNFKLKAGGEYIGLYKPAGGTIDEIDFSEQSTDISFARVPNGNGDFHFSVSPTPGTGNKANPPEKASLTVTSPNGGERLMAGSIQEITWKSSGILGNLRIEYSTNNGQTWQIIDEQTKNDGVKPWEIPTTVSSNCKVRLFPLTDPSTVDESDNVFQIVSAPKPVSLKINEILTSNKTVIQDEDGDYSDWIELYNPTGNRVDLSGYSLTDDSSDERKWIIPNITISGEGYLLIWASGKDRKKGELHTNFSLNSSGEYVGLYAPDGSLIDKLNFGRQDSDIAMARIPSGSGGFQETNTPTPGTKNRLKVPVKSSITILTPNGGEVWYIGSRKKITWKTTGTIAELKVEFSLNDGKNWRQVDATTKNDGSKGWNVPRELSTKCKIRLTSIADENIFDVSDHTFTIKNPLKVESDLVLNEFLSANSAGIIDEDGENSDWIELFNKGNSSIELKNYYLTDDDLDINKWKIPSLRLPPSGYLLIWASGKDRNKGELHANFKLASEGEMIGLYTSENKIADIIRFGKQYENVSEARIPDGEGDFEVTINTTPGTRNKSGTPPFGSLLFNPGSGFYDGEVDVAISCDIPGVEIYYTLDGSQVSSSKKRYNVPIHLTSTSVIRAKAYKKKIPASTDKSEFYLFNFKGHLPVLSLATDEKNLFGSSGIYTKYEKRGKGWERPVSVNYFDLEGNSFYINAGVRIHGSHSRRYPKKSIRLYFREEYGAGKLEFKLFPDIDIEKFDALIIHNTCSKDVEDNENWTLIRDPLLHNIWKKFGGMVSTSRPILLYLNSNFWGIYNLRERIDNHYLQDHCQISDSDLLEIKFNEIPSIKEGDLTNWTKLWDYFKNNNLSNSSNYLKVSKEININNFTDYQIVNIYSGDKDWPHNNYVFFRDRVRDGKWNWILWDRESSFKYEKFLSLIWATRDRPRPDISGSDTHGNYFATLFLRKLLENKAYKEYFINRFLDLLNTEFSSESVERIFNELVQSIKLDIPLEIERWGGKKSEWENGIENVVEFILVRPNIIRNQLKTFFNLSSQNKITVNNQDSLKGKVHLNTLLLPHYPWQGIYFQDIPITLEALPGPGCRFVKWKGLSSSNKSKISVNLNTDSSIEPIWAQYPPSGSVRINEILALNDSLNSDDEGDCSDWLELYNPTDLPIDLSGCWLSDDPNNPYKWQFPGVVLDKNDYLIVWASNKNRKKNGQLHTNFRLSGDGEFLGLYSAAGMLIDSLTFPKQWSNVSYAWLPGATDYSLTSIVTPGLVNKKGVLETALGGCVQYFSNKKGVPKVQITVMGKDEIKGKSDVSGNYRISNLPINNNYVVSYFKLPNKDINQAIMVYDAALTARHAVGLDSLNKIQQKVSDANCDNKVTIFDAALIARYAVGLPAILQAHVGEWVFEPSDIFHALQLNRTSDDTITSYIVGDVDGSWANMLFKSQSPICKDGKFIEKQIYVKSDTVCLPIVVDNTEKVISIDIEMSYPLDKLEFLGVKADLQSEKKFYQNHVCGDRIRFGGYSLAQNGLDNRAFVLLFKKKNSQTDKFRFIFKYYYYNHQLYYGGNVDFQEKEFYPRDFSFSPNFPNPFTDRTVFQFSLPVRETPYSVQIQIYNIRGQIVQEIVNRKYSAGKYAVRWDGRNHAGHKISAGIYFVKIIAGSYRKIQKIQILR